MFEGLEERYKVQEGFVLHEFNSGGMKKGERLVWQNASTKLHSTIEDANLEIEAIKKKRAGTRYPYVLKLRTVKVIEQPLAEVYLEPLQENQRRG